MLVPETHRNRKRSYRWSCAGGCCGLPLLAVGALLLAYFAANRQVRIAVPSRPLPSPNSYDDFLHAGKLIGQVKHKSPLSMSRPDNSFAAFKAAASDAQPALAAMRQGLGKEYLIPSVRSMKATDKFHVLASLHELARTETGIGIFHEMDNNPGKAMEAYLDGLEMAVMMSRGGLLIDGLVEIACESIAESRIEPLIPLLSDPELAHAAARLDVIAAKRTPYADIVQEEGNYQTAIAVEMVNDPRGFSPVAMITSLFADDSSVPGSPPSPKPTLKEGAEALRFLLADKAEIIRQNQRYFTDLAAEARGPYTPTSSVRVPNNPWAQLAGPLFTKSRAQFTAMVAVQSILRTDVALYRYKKMHGAFPTTLDSLTPALLRADSPIDPFTGNLLRYRQLRKGQEFRLYSIGVNGRDDGGMPGSQPIAPSGDIVAGRLWRWKKYKR